MFGAVILLMILIPYLVTFFFYQDGTRLLQKNEDAIKQEERVLLLLSEEISGAAELEAVKAQAVIARTALYENPQMEVTGKADNLQVNLERLQFCVEETSGEILTYQGDPIDSAYHRVSGKRTRNASEVAGQEDKSYLQSVDSSMDIQAEEYLTVQYMEKEQMAAAVEHLLGQTVQMGNPEEILVNLVIEERDSAGYVTRVRYKTAILNGEALRDALELPSAIFYFSELEGKVRILTKGLGHGLGLSQYGADYLAKEGRTYKEILQYYYTGVEIEKIL